MIFTFSDDQEDLRTTIRRFLAESDVEEELRRADAGDPVDPGTWRRLAGELGLTGLAVPEDFGGAGCGFVEVGVVLEELGRTLYGGPYFSTVVLATTALLESGDREVARTVLPGMIDGTRTAAVLMPAFHGDDLGAGALAARSDASGWRLEGVHDQVIDGATVDLVLAFAETDRGTSLFLVEAGTEGLVRTPMQSLDVTRRLARVELVDAPARLVGEPGAGDLVLQRVRRAASVAIAVESVGGAQACCDQAFDYARTRVQFGRAIGSFQAVKHKCADMLLALESARSAAYYALWAFADTLDDAAASAHLAKAFCADAFLTCAQENIQIHGGIGFTWEHHAHRYLKRAKADQQMFGSSTQHRELLAQYLDLV